MIVDQYFWIYILNVALTRFLTGRSSYSLVQCSQMKYVGYCIARQEQAAVPGSTAINIVAKMQFCLLFPTWKTIDQNRPVKLATDQTSLLKHYPLFGTVSTVSKFDKSSEV